MAIQTGTQGILANAQAGTGASADSVYAGPNLAALHIQASSAGAVSTWTIEQSLDGGATWKPLLTPAGAALSIALDGPYAIAYPAGHYRTNVTTSGSAFTARFLKGPDAR